MKSRSPTLEGFRAILVRPSYGFAEIAWRWSFGSAAALLLGLAAFEYLDTLPVSKGDLALLKTRHPFLISQAIAHIFRGSAFRLTKAGLLIAVALGMAWIVLATLARSATLEALGSYFHEERPPSQFGLLTLFALSSLQLTTTVAAAIGGVGAIVLGSFVTSTGDPAPGSALLVFLTIALAVWLAWSSVSWFLSLAAVFAVVRDQDVFGSLRSALDLCHTRPASVFAVGTWFGVAHAVAFVVATSAVAFPLGFAGALPLGMVFGGVLLVTLLYFAVADFLHLGRLAAFVAILELPNAPVAPVRPPAGSPSNDAVDPTELILSDVRVGY